MKQPSEMVNAPSWQRLRQGLGQPRVCWSGWCVVGCAVAVLLYLYSPEATRWYPRCPFHYLTGLNCPGCGSLRALHAVLHGRMTEALCSNPLLVACLPILAIWLAVRGFGALALNRVLEVRFPASVSFGVALGVAVFFIVRNIPVYPFILLSP